MKARISAIGYTSVIMILNMKRFIAENDLEKFESLRGTAEFTHILRNCWAKVIHAPNSKFITMADDKKQRGLQDTMSIDKVGFATGVFRAIFLEDHAVPGYVLKKETVEFPDDLKGNFQFRKLFLRAWKSWKIYIRPTMTGMFLIRLTREYTQPRELIKMAEDVLNLQESLDVKSAHAWLEQQTIQLQNKPDQLAKIRNSVNTFLEWLGSNIDASGEFLYNPVQWKIAMETISHFVEAMGTIDLPSGDVIHLYNPTPRLSIPLHDSYITYHINEIFADGGIVVRDGKSASENQQESLSDIPLQEKAHQQIPVLPEDLKNSPLIKRALLNLIEGAILEREKTTSSSDGQRDRFFPVLRWQNLDGILEQNLASWMEEICLLTSRTALIIPSRKCRKDYLLVSTTPGATMRVNYLRYWEAIERMIEFSLEIRTLAQLVERKSYLLLGALSREVDSARKSLQAGDIDLDRDHLPTLVGEAYNIRRLAAMAQGMSDPHVWSRTEYAIIKAQHLLEQLGLPILLTHIGHNISSLDSVVNHVDELYALDLAEKGNDLSFVLTVGLAAISFILTIIMLPSFWTDLQQIRSHDSPPLLNGLLSNDFLQVIEYLGTFLGAILLIFSFLLIFAAAKHWKLLWKMTKRSFERLGR